MRNLIFARLFNIFAKTQKTQIYKHWDSNAIKINSMCTDATYADFSSKDKEKILNVINNSNSKEDLLQYSITTKRAEKLKSHVIKNGPYNSIEDLLQVKGMNATCLHKFFKSIVYGKEKKVKKLKLNTIPKIITNDQKDVNTILGVYVGQNMISWSLLNRDCEVLQWNYQLFPKDKSMNNLHSLLEITLPIAELLPKADRYIMQENSSKLGYERNYRFNPFYIHQSIITTSILSYLSWHHKLDDIEKFLANNIFILRHNSIQEIYGLLIGKESVSTQYVLQKLLQESDKFVETKERLPNVLIGAHLKNIYENQDPIYQEQISWPLLLAFSFMELIVHQRTDMIYRYRL